MGYNGNQTQHCIHIFAGSLLALDWFRYRPGSKNMSSEDVGSDRPQLDLTRLWKEWDGQDDLRNFVRAKHALLFTEGTTETVKTASQAYRVAYLTPLLHKMAATEGSPQPLVDPLRDQIAQFYRENSKEVSDDQVINDSWYTRKFLGFVKKKARLGKPSKVSRFLTI